MKKYILEICVVFFCIVIGVGVVGEINNNADLSQEVNSFEESIENNDEIKDGNMSNVRVEEDDSSNLISDVNAKLASFIVEGINGALKVVVNIISSITN